LGTRSDFEDSKTQLAFDFCSKYNSDHPDALVIWISSETRPYLEERLREISGHLSIVNQTNISESVASWLRMHSQNDWVLVLDDVGNEFQTPSPESNNDTTFPSPTILFHTLNGETKTLEESLTNALKLEEAQVILLYPTLNDSLQIFKQHCPNIPWEEGVAEQVTASLEFSPLALSIAAAYMEDNGITFSEYLDLFRQCDLSSTPSTFSTSVARALMVSLGQLQSERPQAIGICKLMAVLDRQSVVESLLFYDRKGQNARNFYGSLRKLDSLSLVQKAVRNNHYSMHRLVRDFFIEYLENEGKLESQQQSAIELLSERYPFGDQSFWTVCRAYNPHAEKAIKFEGPDTWPMAVLTKSMAAYQRSCGSFGAACTLYKKVLKIYASNAPLSAKQEDLVVDLSLAVVEMLGKMSQFDAGEKLLQDTMGKIKSVVEPGHPQLIHARGLQAWFCSWRGQHAEAERLWRLCLKDNNEIYYKTHVESLIYESNITTTLIKQRKYAEAEVLLAQTIRGRISVRGNDHPDTIQSQQILAGLYQEQGKYTKAEELNREILGTANRVQGSEHPDTLTIVGNLSVNLSALGRFSEAEVMQWRLLASRERQFGSEHEQVVLSRINLAITLEKLGKYSVAEEQNRLALAAQKKLFPADTHPTTLNIENTLGLLLLRQGKYEEAEPILREVLRKRRETPGMEHRDILTSQNNLAGTLMKQKKYGESKTLFADTLKTSKTLLGEENAFTLRLMNNLSEVMRQGSFEAAENERQSVRLEALGLQRTALNGRITIFGEDHPDVFTSESNLARLLHDMERCIEARQLFEKAAEGLGRKLGKDHPMTIECETNFTVCKSHR
jgi:tetratricopeptide (TPR) repeat protein